MNSARKLYSNVYIFERGIAPLHTQRNNREFEIIVKECIYNTIRDNIPVEELIKMYLEETIEDVVEVTENEEVIKQEPILSEEDANLSARRRTSHSSTRRRRHRERSGDRVSGDGSGDGDDDGDHERRPHDAGAGSDRIDNLDFVGELNGSGNASRESTAADHTGSGNNGGVSFGANEIRTFETDASERKNEYMTHDDAGADADAYADAYADDNDSGRLSIGGDIKLDTFDIHTLNDIQTINAPPLLDDIEVLS